jgi:hypothetical protein
MRAELYLLQVKMASPRALSNKMLPKDNRSLK